MNPNPFDALNHFTVPFAIPEKPPHGKMESPDYAKKSRTTVPRMRHPVHYIRNFKYYDVTE
jgi:hypothetical protein